MCVTSSHQNLNSLTVVFYYPFQYHATSEVQNVFIYPFWLPSIIIKTITTSLGWKRKQTKGIKRPTDLIIWTSCSLQRGPQKWPMAARDEIHNWAEFVSFYYTVNGTVNHLQSIYIKLQSYKNSESVILARTTKLNIKYVLMMFSCWIISFLQVFTVSPCHSDHLGLTNEEVFLMNHVNYIPYPNRYILYKTCV